MKDAVQSTASGPLLGQAGRDSLERILSVVATGSTRTMPAALLAAAIPAMFFSTSGWFDRQIGELSYPLYLCHIAIMRFLTPLEVIRDSPALRTFFVVFFSILIAIALRILIDLPMNIYRQNRFSQAQGKQ